MRDRRLPQTPARLAGKVEKGVQKRARKSAATGAKATRTTQKALTEALDRLSTVLSDTLPQIVAEGADQASAASIAARQRLADTAEAFADAIRPRRRRRRVRTLVILGALLGFTLPGLSLGTSLRRLLSRGQRPTGGPGAAAQPASASASAPETANGVAAIRETALRAAGRVGEAVMRLGGSAVGRSGEMR
jgi:hypothetical protein